MNINMSGESKEQWERLRSSKKNMEYCIESDKESYEKNCIRDIKNQQLAKILIGVLGMKEQTHIISLGVGKAHLEWYLKHMNPNVQICCTDYTEKALTNLEKVFVTGNNFLQFDMLKDDYKRLKGYDYVLLNRVNSEFSFTQWKGIYDKMAKSGIRKIIFIPSRFGNVADFCKSVLNRLDEKRAVKISWRYTEYEFLKMWKHYYRIVKKISFNDSAIYCLELRKNNFI